MSDQIEGLRTQLALIRRENLDLQAAISVRNAKLANAIASISIVNERADAMQAEIDRYRDDLRLCRARFMDIIIVLSRGGTKREAIAIADLAEDCIKGYLVYGRNPDA